jgi:hypothetical protein
VAESAVWPAERRLQGLVASGERAEVATIGRPVRVGTAWVAALVVVAAIVMVIQP